MKKIHRYNHDKTYRAVENIDVIIDTYSSHGPDSCIKNPLELSIAALQACDDIESVIKDLEKEREKHAEKDFSDFDIGQAIAYQDALRRLNEALAPFKALVEEE